MPFIAISGPDEKALILVLYGSTNDDQLSAEQDARLIVTAVNTHDDLIAALRQIEDMIRDVTRAPDSLPQMVLAVTRAALAKAESHD